MAYFGEIRWFASSSLPSGWMPCDGTALPIVGNEGIFNAIGTTFGGDGVNNFWLPNMKGRCATHSQGINLGFGGGLERVTLTVSQLPAHTHDIGCTSASHSSSSPNGHILATSGSNTYYNSSLINGSLANVSVSATGSGVSHNNIQPSTVLVAGILVSGGENPV